MLKLCKYSDVAVCKMLSDRDYYSSIYKIMYPDVVLCKHVMYRIKSSNTSEFFITSLEFTKIGKNGCYIRDMFTGANMILTRENLSLICTSPYKDCKCELYEKVY